MKILSAIGAALLLFAAAAPAQTTNGLSAAEIKGRELARQLCAAQPAENFTNTGVLKFKDAKGKGREVSVRFITKIKPTNWIGIFQGIEAKAEAADKLVVTHQESLPGKYSIVHVCGPGITFSQLDAWGTKPFSEKDELMVPFCGSDFSAMDLGLEFFHWPQQKLLKKEVKRSRGCSVLESTNPDPGANGYSRVVSWLDDESGGIVQAQAYDAQGRLLKEFYPKDFQKVNGQWQVGTMQIENVQTKSRTLLKFDLDKE